MPTNQTATAAPPTATSTPEVFASLIDRGLEVLEFTVPVDQRKVTATIASPAKDKLAAKPWLLLTIGGASSHLVPPNHLPAEAAWERGHRVVSISVPSYGPSLETLRDAVLSGPDPFEAFNEEAQAVLDYCIAHGLADRDRIVVTGISRFAYAAFRLMAANEHLKIGGGFAPVTDWRDLSEFAGQRDLQVIADLNLSRYADQLAGKKIYMAIGSHDERVNTRSACQLFLDLNAANQKRGAGPELVDFYVTPDLGHRCGDEWYQLGMKILLDHAESTSK